MSAPSIEISRLTVAGPRGEPLLSEVSLQVSSGATYVLLGEGAAPRELLRCVLGERGPDAGTVLIGGSPPRRARRRLGRKLLALDDGEVAPESPSFDLAVVANPRPDVLARLGGESGTILAASSSPETARAAQGRIGILRRGRLLVEGTADELTGRFRRIHYANRMTESRTAFGTELDEFESVRVRVRGWGVEAIVSDFRGDAFDRFRSIEGVENASAEPMDLREIYESIAGT